MTNNVKYYTNSFVWSVIAKILDAAIKFLTIPLLLSYYGKESFGLLTLALATNAYLQLLDMGMNTGGVKFFSQWISLRKNDLIHKVARTNISFYLLIGLINSVILLYLGIWGQTLFKISPDQYVVFRHLLFILASFSIVNWITFVFNQLLIANEKIGYTQQITSTKSILVLFVIILTIHFKWSLTEYFFSYSFVNTIVIIPFYFACKKQNLINSILPAFYWKDFSVVLRYSLAILAIGIFQFTATQSRPLILGAFSNKGVSILSEYRIIEVFPIFIISIGGMLISILLPKASQAIQNNDRATIEKFAYTGSIYSTILVLLLCCPIIINAKELIQLYVGREYTFLYNWLIIWVFTIIIYLFNSPVSSLVLATGKTKMLVYSSAIACIISIIINISLCNFYGVGSAVIGYLVYIIIQMSFYFFYFNKKVLGLDSLKVFKAFIYPTLIGLFSMFIVLYVYIPISSIILIIILRTLLWLLSFGFFLFLFRIIKLDQIRTLIKKQI